ncbi:MAG TPA: hypothetical protein VN256_15230 [Pyrinomonadaceae bacterium]|nr:hypothetical protein [Pyrinomonadaceae bacterium]
MLKRFMAAALVVTLCAGGVLSQARRRRQAPAQAEGPLVNIIQVDFKNYTFPLNGKAYKLIDGFYAEAAGADAQWGLMMADGPYYGDLTGDKKEEAAFVFRYGPVGGFNMAEARVYTLRGGRAELLATLVVANSVDCELDHYIDVDDGMLRVERVFGSGTQCDHNEVTQYRWDGSGFMPVGEVKTRPCRCM